MSFGARVRFDYEGMKRLKEAADHVTHGWLPIDPACLDEVRRKNAAKAYKSGSEMVDDIAADFALLAYCFKDLQNRGGDRTPDFNPVTLLRQLTPDELSALLPASEAAASAHRRSRGNLAQLLQTRLAQAAAATVIDFAKALGISCDLLLSIEIHRQLGLSLIAWNYARLFSQALSQSRRGFNSLEDALKSCMGVSPHSLSGSVVRGWRLGNELERALNVASSRPIALRSGSAEGAGTALTLGRLCEAVETLVRSADPKSFPGAREQWRNWEEILQRYLEEKTLADIKESFSKRSGKALTNLKPQRTARPAEGRPAANEPNLHVNIARVGIENFMSSVLPSWGFSSGCVYAVEQDRLIPTFLIGSATESEFQPISREVITHDTEPLIKSLNVEAPYLALNSSVLGRQVSFICGVVSQPPIALLYLEMAVDLRMLTTDEQLERFSAARKALASFLLG